MLKKIFCFLSILILISAIIPISATGASVSCSASKSALKPGESVEIYVYLESAEEFTSIGLTPMYDTNKLEIISGYWSMSGAVLSDFNGVDAVAAFSSPVKKSGNVFSFTLMAKSDIALGELTIGVSAVAMNGNNSVDIYSAGGVMVDVICVSHNLGQWKQTIAPTVTEQGEEIAQCENSGCSYSETRKIPALGITSNSSSIISSSKSSSVISSQSSSISFSQSASLSSESESTAQSFDSKSSSISSSKPNSVVQKESGTVEITDTTDNEVGAENKIINKNLLMICLAGIIGFLAGASMVVIIQKKNNNKY